MDEKPKTPEQVAKEKRKAHVDYLKKLAKSNPPAQDLAARIARLEAMVELSE